MCIYIYIYMDLRGRGLVPILPPAAGRPRMCAGARAAPRDASGRLLLSIL